MSKKDNADLDKEVELFDPHPGRAGAAIPIPEAVRLVAVDLVGKRMPLRDALNRFRALTIAQYPGIDFDVVPEYGYIKLHINCGPGKPEHIFRVIRYR